MRVGVGRAHQGVGGRWRGELPPPPVTPSFHRACSPLRGRDPTEWGGGLLKAVALPGGGRGSARLPVCQRVCARACVCVPTSSVSHQPRPSPRAPAGLGDLAPQPPPPRRVPPHPVLTAPALPSQTRTRAPRPPTCSMLLPATPSSPRRPRGAPGAAAPPCALSVRQPGDRPARAARVVSHSDPRPAPPRRPRPLPSPPTRGWRRRAQTRARAHNHTRA